MNRLGDALRKALHANPPALGFRPTEPTKPHMVLIAAISEASNNVASWTQGAEAVIFGPSLKPRELKSATKALTVPWGVWIDSATSHPAEPAGTDFVIFEPDKAGLELMSNECLGKVLALNASHDNTLLHGICELPVEAIYLKRAPQDIFTLQELMQCRRLADLVTKPLLVPVAPDTPPIHFKTLWEAGVDGVVVTATAENSLKALRLEIDRLGLRARRKWLRARPLVPITSPVLPLNQNDEDESEDAE
ncbi:MAG: hypothetical protein FWH51_04825 [Dehalococcoidia bacterium]|nr:hypothetical protein [Dehalococcoidia bacterium]